MAVIELRSFCLACYHSNRKTFHNRVLVQNCAIFSDRKANSYHIHSLVHQVLSKQQSHTGAITLLSASNNKGVELLDVGQRNLEIITRIGKSGKPRLHHGTSFCGRSIADISFRFNPYRKPTERNLRILAFLVFSRVSAGTWRALLRGTRTCSTLTTETFWSTWRISDGENGKNCHLGSGFSWERVLVLRLQTRTPPAPQALLEASSGNTPHR
jgi:hypothetical protein